MAILARINLQKINDWRKSFRKGGHHDLVDYFDPELIFFLNVETRDAALKALVDGLHKSNRLRDSDAFYQAILEREKIVSTGIGIGVAIPHAKVAEQEDFFVAVGIQRTGGIPWNALDGSLVRLIFMIGGPENKQAEYLSLLSRLTLAVKDEDRRKKLLKVRQSNEVLSLFEGC